MKLIVITPPGQVVQELATIHELFAMGLEILHLRKPGLTIEQIKGMLSGIERRYLKRIMLHNHHGLLNEFDLRGSHFSAALREGLGSPDLPERYSTSCHTIAELKQLKSGYDYCFISPLFNSISKPGYQAGIDRTELAETLMELQTPVVALGGISERTLPEVPRDCLGAAVLGAIWQEDDLRRRLENYEQLQRIVNA